MLRNILELNIVQSHIEPEDISRESKSCVYSLHIHLAVTILVYPHG